MEVRRGSYYRRSFDLIRSSSLCEFSSGDIELLAVTGSRCHGLRCHGLRGNALSSREEPPGRETLLVDVIESCLESSDGVRTEGAFSGGPSAPSFSIWGIASEASRELVAMLTGRVEASVRGAAVDAAYDIEAIEVATRVDESIAVSGRRYSSLDSFVYKSAADSAGSWAVIFEKSCSAVIMKA